MALDEVCKGEGKYAGMDYCHARDQPTADFPGHGKNYFDGESHPQKEKVERYAASFQKLADTFYGMPYRKEYLSSGQIDAILKDTNEEMCSRCYHREICWGENSGFLKQGGEAMIRAMEEGDEEAVEMIRQEWAEICGKSIQYLETGRERFQKNRIWYGATA